MKRYRRPIVFVAPALVLLAIWGLQELFPYLLREHALKAESPYFLVACVICAAVPLTVGVFCGVHWYLLRRGTRTPAGIDELVDVDAEDATRADRRDPKRRQRAGESR
jgi:hypothetical protein